MTGCLVQVSRRSHKYVVNSCLNVDQTIAVLNIDLYSQQQ